MKYEKIYKASSIVKTEVKIEDIMERIEDANSGGEFKIFFPHFINISDETKLAFLNKGYKVYVGDWDGIYLNVTIIEW